MKTNAPTPSNTSTSNVPELSRAKQADALGDGVPRITLEQIQKFNRESEKALLNWIYLPSSGPEPLFYQYANTHRLQRSLLIETLDFLHEVGCPFPQSKTYGAEPFLQVHLWGIIKAYWHPQATVEEIYYLFTFEWDKVKGVFFDEDQKVPQTFLSAYRSAAERVIMAFAPDLKRAAYVAGGCGGPGNALSSTALQEGDSDETSERVLKFAEGRPFKIKPQP